MYKELAAEFHNEAEQEEEADEEGIELKKLKKTFLRKKNDKRRT